MKEIPKVHLTNSLSHYFHFLFKDLRYLLNMIDGHVELQTIHVDNASESIRCECWKHNVANQFLKVFAVSVGNIMSQISFPSNLSTIQMGTLLLKWDLLMKDTPFEPRY